MRADAARNREKLLEAAERVFAEKGVSAPTEEVARAAGVGIGTLFRHFPTKESLLEAVLQARLKKVADSATALSTMDDAGEAFRSFFTDVIGQSAGKKALTDALAETGADIDRSLGGARRDLGHALKLLLERAQKSGAIRADVRMPDLAALVVGAARALEQVGEDPAAQRRVIAVLLDGLRAR